MDHIDTHHVHPYDKCSLRRLCGELHPSSGAATWLFVAYARNAIRHGPLRMLVPMSATQVDEDLYTCKVSDEIVFYSAQTSKKKKKNKKARSTDNFHLPTGSLALPL